MPTFQIEFWGDNWDDDKNYEYLTIDCKDLDEVIEYLRKNCGKQYNTFMYTNSELSVWQHKNDGNVVLWYNTFAESNTFDLTTNEEDVTNFQDNFIKNGRGSQKPLSERPYKKIKLEDLDKEQFKNFTYLILQTLIDDYGGIYLTINYKVNDKFIRYPLNSESESESE